MLTHLFNCYNGRDATRRIELLDKTVVIVKRCQLLCEYITRQRDTETNKSQLDAKMTWQRNESFMKRF